MKGQKAYKIAKSIHKKMYDTTLHLEPEEQKTLYIQYFEEIKKAAYKGHFESLYDMGNQFEDVARYT